MQAPLSCDYLDIGESYLLQLSLSSRFGTNVPLDIYIGSLPSRRDLVYSYGLGISKHLGISHFYGRPDSRGRYEVGGLTIHMGVDFGAPFFASQTFPDSNIIFSNLSDKELSFESDSGCVQRLKKRGLHDR